MVTNRLDSGILVMVVVRKVNGFRLGELSGALYSALRARARPRRSATASVISGFWPWLFLVRIRARLARLLTLPVSSSGSAVLF